MGRGATLLAILALVVGPSCGRTPSERPGPEGGASARGPDRRTGAVDSLAESTLAGRQADGVDELLRGRVAGLQVVQQANGDIALRIRGTSSLLDPGDALLVIDGMPVSAANVTGALRSLKAHEIASIEVLKDVSSTSVYGMAGANGVILITTKRE